MTGAACTTHNKHSCASCSSAYRLKDPDPTDNDNVTKTCQPYVKLWDWNYYNDNGDPGWGGSFKEAIGNSRYVGNDINDDISSIENPHGHPFSLYEHENYGGGCIHFNTSVPALRWTENGYTHQYNWIGTDRQVGDRASSYRIGSWCQ